MTRLALLFAALPFAAHAADLSVDDAFSRASVGNAPGVAYFTVHGGDAADRLLSVSSPRAGHAAMHTMIMQGEVMRMREVDAIDVPAGGTVALRPGGLHVMLEQLTSPLRPGETVPLTLSFEHAGQKQVAVPVGPAGATGPGSHAN